MEKIPVMQKSVTTIAEVSVQGTQNNNIEHRKGEKPKTFKIKKGSKKIH